ncbi:MAG: metallophosphoesterase [Candidatus Hodarchaeota archaeon]
MKKLKILAVSDIHVDINSPGSSGDEANQGTFLEKASELLEQITEVDLVVCAGDISPSITQLQRTLDVITKSIESTYYVFVPGNHDIWELDQKLWEGITREKYEQGLRESVNRTKFRYLPQQPLVIAEDLAIIGNIGWYDYSFRNPKWDNQVTGLGYNGKRWEGYVWYDVNFTDWGMPDVEVTEYLLNQLVKDYQKIKTVPHKMAVMHHIPFREGVVYKDSLPWDFFCAFMGADCFGNFFQEGNIKLVIHGHTHFPQVYRVGSCRVYCAPLGYRHEWHKSKDFSGVLRERIKLFEIP